MKISMSVWLKEGSVNNLLTIGVSLKDNYTFRLIYAENLL